MGETSLGDASDVLYLFPRKRYMYWTPKGLRGRDKVQNQHAGAGGNRTSPFISFWYVNLAPAIGSGKLLRTFRGEARNDELGGATLCRLDDLPPAAWTSSQGDGGTA